MSNAAPLLFALIAFLAFLVLFLLARLAAIQRRIKRFRRVITRLESSKADPLDKDDR